MLTLWEWKGIKWPSENPEPLQHNPIASSLSNVTLSGELEPLTVEEEEEEQLAAALKESTTFRNETQTIASENVTQTLALGENDNKIERT